MINVRIIDAKGKEKVSFINMSEAAKDIIALCQTWLIEDEEMLEVTIKVKDTKLRPASLRRSDFVETQRKGG